MGKIKNKNMVISSQELKRLIVKFPYIVLWEGYTKWYSGCSAMLGGWWGRPCENQTGGANVKACVSALRANISFPFAFAFFPVLYLRLTHLNSPLKKLTTPNSCTLMLKIPTRFL